MKKFYLGQSVESDTNAVMNVWFVQNKWNGFDWDDFENGDELMDRAFDTIKGFGTMDGSLEMEVVSSDYEMEEVDEDEE